MIAFFEPGDTAMHAQFLALMSEGIERIRDPERYAQLRMCRTELVKFRESTERESEDQKAVDVAIGNVSTALERYENADPHQVVNDMLNNGRS